jgi:hypothetical protein
MFKLECVYREVITTLCLYSDLIFFFLHGGFAYKFDSAFITRIYFNCALLTVCG